MENEFDEFVRAAVITLIRLVYGADNAEIINGGGSVVFKLNGETKYATIQVFYYEGDDFAYNKETFSGEVGVIQISPSYIRVFNRDKVKKELLKNKKLIKKNKHNDMTIPFRVVSHLVQQTKSEEN